MSEDKIELTEEMVNTLDNPPKANNAFKAAAKKYKGEDIKMADVFDLPVEVDLGFACIRNGETTDIANFDISEEGIERTKAAVHAINNHDNLIKQVAELRAALGECSNVLGRPEYFNEGSLSELWEVVRKSLNGSE